MKEISLMEIGGFAVGHAHNEAAATGCTVVLFDKQSPVGIDIRGGGPASRETPLLDPHMAAQGLHGILLSGGSAFGLDAAGGVMRWLEERGRGLAVGPTVVPLVCQSDVFDLGIGDYRVRPDAAMAYAACDAAGHTMPALGNVGVGIGCTVGKVMGPQRAMKSGIGAYAVQVGEVQVGALVAVNAVGDVYDPDTGKELAGVRGPQPGQLLQSEQVIWAAADQMRTDGAVTNTTIGIVFTNAVFNKGELGKIAGMAQDGYARTIRPVHTSNDGDTIYAASTGTAKANLDLVGTLAAYVMGKAVNCAVQQAAPAYGLPSAQSWHA